MFSLSLCLGVVFLPVVDVADYSAGPGGGCHVQPIRGKRVLCKPLEIAGGGGANVSVSTFLWYVIKILPKILL